MNLNFEQDLEQEKNDFFHGVSSVLSVWAQYDGNQEALKQKLHTLKGIAFVLGLVEFGEAIHETETLLGKGEFQAAYSFFHARMQGELNRRSITHNHENRGGSIPTLKNVIHDYWLPRWEKTFQTVWATQGDKRILFQYDFFSLPEIFIPSEFLNDFFPLVEHLIRNAVIHGIERPHVRELYDKKKTGYIKIDVSLHCGLLKLLISDDGKGFYDVPNTPAPINHFSGRGVGMAAVSDGVAKLGGYLTINSELGKFTQIEMIAPYPEMMNGIFCLFETAHQHSKNAIPLSSVTGFKLVDELIEIQQQQQNILAQRIFEPQELVFSRPPFSQRFFAAWENDLYVYEPKVLTDNQLTDIDVFVIDDVPLMRNTLRSFLKNFRPNLTVKEYEDGEAAWNALKAGLRPKLILCDWEMPRMTGDELLRNITKNHINTAFVMISSRNVGDYRAVTIENGAIDFLGKPFEHERLKEIINNLKIGI